MCATMVEYAEVCDVGMQILPACRGDTCSPDHFHPQRCRCEDPPLVSSSQCQQFRWCDQYPLHPAPSANSTTSQHTHNRQCEKSCIPMCRNATCQTTVVNPATTSPALPPSRRLLVGRLDLEAARRPATTSSLELAALGLDVGLAALEGATEVGDGLTDVALSTEEDSVGAGGGAEGELVEGDGLTAGGDDAGADRVGEAEGGDRELGDSLETLVVEDRADNDNSLRVVGVRAAGLLDNARDRDRRAVDLGCGLGFVADL